MSLNYVAVLAVSMIAGGLSAFVVGLLAGRLCLTLPKRIVWALSAMVWVLAIMTVYSILTVQLSVLLDPIVFACVLLVTCVSARWAYRFSSSRAQQHRGDAPLR